LAVLSAGRDTSWTAPSVRISQNYTLDSRELLPGYVKTSKGIIPPREIYHTLSSMDGIVKEIGIVKKEKSKTKHLLGLKHINIPIQLDLWGNEVIFRGKGTDNNIWIP
jgi:hypothetical protein